MNSYFTIRPRLSNKLSLQEKLEFYSIPEPNSGCYLWLGSLRNKGYGQLKWKETTQRAHRLAWEIVNGKIPNGMRVLHKCDVPCCVNPAHLFLGTDADNSKDMVTKGRSARGEKHSKITALDVIAIRSDTRIYKLISANYGLSISTISSLKNRKHWKHV